MVDMVRPMAAVMADHLGIEERHHRDMLLVVDLPHPLRLMALPRVPILNCGTGSRLLTLTDLGRLVPLSLKEL
jgi:hypothetical protein